MSSQTEIFLAIWISFSMMVLWRLVDAFVERYRARTRLLYPSTAAPIDSVDLNTVADQLADSRSCDICGSYPHKPECPDSEQNHPDISINPPDGYPPPGWQL